LERYVVVGEVVAEVGLGRRGRLAPLRFLPRRALAALATEAAAATALAAPAEHLHLVGDDLGEELLDAVLAGVLVVADLALDIDLRTLAQVLAGDLGQLAEEGHPVPLGVLLGVAVAVLAHRGGGQADLGDRHAALGVLGLGVVAQVADQDRLVDAARHCRPSGFARIGQGALDYTRRGTAVSRRRGRL